MEFSPEQQQKIRRWSQNTGVDYLWLVEMSPFSDPEFLTKFEQTVPENEQEKFVTNTFAFKEKFGQNSIGKSDIADENEYNPNYVIFARRALVCDEAKPEQYWSHEYAMPRRQLRVNEAVRLHSEMLITTFDKLINHGVVENGTDPTMGTGENGEIIIDPKPFPASNFLFTFKPRDEQEELETYLKNGGISRQALTQKMRERAENLATLPQKNHEENQLPPPPSADLII